MSLLGPIGAERFLKEYWQKKPFLIRHATSEYEHVLSPEELAGLALEDQIESRIIRSDESGEDWQLQYGPVTAAHFEKLPEKNWTLLVQSVDQWVPEVADILRKFTFLPRWRLDDVMISYATKGGGVGPHFDYYDVFLLQVSGQRRWRLGQRCDEKTPLKVDQPLKLLANFEQTAEHLLRPGDMLYVPAGVAHWGRAEDDDCMTWSIGFRAPSASELLMNAAEQIAATLPESLRYRDIGNVSGSAEISSSVDEGLDALFASINKQDLMVAVKQAFMTQVTEPRYLESIDILSSEELKSALEDVALGCALVERSPHSRFAYQRLTEEDAKLFVDGASFEAPLKVAKMLAEQDIEPDSASMPMIKILLKAGALILI